MTCRPTVQRVAKQAGSDHPHAGPQRLAFTPEPWQAGQAVGKQGTEIPLLKPKLRGWEYFPGGREGRPRLAPLAPSCTTLGEADPPRRSQGRGKGLSQEVRGRLWVTGPALGAFWACESAPRSAPWGLLCSRAGAGGGGMAAGRGRRGPTLHLGHPAPTRPRASAALEAPTPAGVSQQLWAGGAAWLHAPCVEGHTLTFGERRGEAVRSREGTSFSSKLLSMWAGPPKQVGPQALLQGCGGLLGEG